MADRSVDCIETAKSFSGAESHKHVAAGDGEYLHPTWQQRSRPTNSTRPEAMEGGVARSAASASSTSSTLRGERRPARWIRSLNLLSGVWEVTLQADCTVKPGSCTSLEAILSLRHS